MQQNIASQEEDLEIAMKMEASRVGETGIGMNHIHSQLSNLTIQLQDIKNGKEVDKEVWCNRCRSKGHHKDQCLYFHEYL